ncbi:hypothetical protein [Bacillus cereus]
MKTKLKGMSPVQYPDPCLLVLPNEIICLTVNARLV